MCSDLMYACMSSLVCVFVCVYVCMCVCVYSYVRICVSVYLCICVSVYLCICVSVYLWENQKLGKRRRLDGWRAWRFVFRLVLAISRRNVFCDCLSEKVVLCLAVAYSYVWLGIKAQSTQSFAWAVGLSLNAW